MSGFKSPEGDFDRVFVKEYELADRYGSWDKVYATGNLNGVSWWSTTSKSSYVQMSVLGSGWKEFGRGYNYQGTHAGIKTDGSLWGFGSSKACLGINEAGSNTGLVRMYTNATVTAFESCAVGYFTTAAVGVDGSLWTCGNNYDGSLANNSTVDTQIAVRVGSGNDWKSVSQGGIYIPGDSPSMHQNFFGLKTDGTLWGWGNNMYGMVGDNSYTNRSSPVQITGSWRQVSAGIGQHCGIKTDGTLWVWGDGMPSPVPVGTSTDWKQVTNGGEILAIKNNGTLWSTASTALQQIGTGSDWKYCDGGNETTRVAVKFDGSLWAWGSNNGFYGNGFTGAGTPYVPTKASTMNEPVRKVFCDMDAVWVLTD